MEITLLNAIELDDVELLNAWFDLDDFADVNLPIPSHAYFITPLMFAVECDSPGVVRLLLSKGARVNKRDDIGRTVLTVCLDKPIVNLEILTRLLNADITLIDKVDITGRTPLIIAAGHSFDAVKLLVEKGAAVMTKDSGGKTALMEAAAKNQLETVKFLVDAGSVIDARDASNNTALLYAASLNIFGRDSREIVKYLIEKGANINAKNNQSQTVAMWAAKRGYADILNTLLSLQCDISVVDSKGWSALKYAREWDCIEIVEMIEAIDKNLPEICILVHVNNTPYELHNLDSCTTNVAVGQKSTMLFSICNYGTTDLIISSIDLTNISDFILNATQMAYVVKAHAHTIFEIIFSPAEVKAYSTELKIVSNDPNEKLTTITINGNAK
jgi:ankyrin repeat protein